jgi:hypothetical protein
MKKISVFLLAAGFCFFGAAQASTSYSPFGVNLSLLGRGAFCGTENMAFAGGLGASLYGDWRPVKWISLGTGLSFTGFPGDKAWSVGTWDAGVKLFPFSASRYGEWYFQGLLGWNFLGHNLNSSTPGNYHAGWGIGYLVFLGEGMALDLCPGYDLYTPFHEASLHSLTMRAGLTWLLGKER